MLQANVMQSNADPLYCIECALDAVFWRPSQGWCWLLLLSCCCFGVIVVVLVLFLLLLFLYCIELYAWALMQCSRDLLEGVAGVEAALK